MIRQLVFLVLLLSVSGCGRSPQAASAESSATPLTDAEVELAQAELKTFAYFVTNQPKGEHIERRQAWLRSQIVAAGYEFPKLPEDALQWPAGEVWVDPDSPNREQCRHIRDELVALAIGRGMAGSWPAIRPRMRKLQSLLIRAGYDFDENGRETTHTDEGELRSDYTALGENFGHP